jgi:hypothetical protein
LLSNSYGSFASRAFLGRLNLAWARIARPSSPEGRAMQNDISDPKPLQKRQPNAPRLCAIGENPPNFTPNACVASYEWFKMG